MGNCLPLLSVLCAPEPAVAKVMDSLSSDATSGKRKPKIGLVYLKSSSRCCHCRSSSSSNNSNSSSFSRCSHHFGFLGGAATVGRLEDFYEIGVELGRGQSGVIRRCVNRSSRKPFACKTVARASLHTEAERQSVRHEVAAMLSLRGRSRGMHPGIVRLEEVMEDVAGVHMVMELCSGGDLYDRIVEKRSFSEAEAAPLLETLVDAIRYCHLNGIIHRDLKPENILLTESGEIKLADFGLAIPFTPGQRFRGRVGSPYYVAPEVLGGEYSAEMDVWSAGVILYILLSGEPPFWGSTDALIVEAVRRGKLHFPKQPWASISPSAKNLICGMLCTDVHTRLTPAQILKHPWILNHCVNPVAQRSLIPPPIERGESDDEEDDKEEEESSCNDGEFAPPLTLQLSLPPIVLSPVQEPIPIPSSSLQGRCCTSDQCTPVPDNAQSVPENGFSAGEGDQEEQAPVTPSNIAIISTVLLSKERGVVSSLVKSSCLLRCAIPTATSTAAAGIIHHHHHHHHHHHLVC